MSEIKAKLVRKIESGMAWYFDKYELECIDCGKHYMNGRYDARTNPYCSDCRRKYEREKQQILKEKKQYQAKKIVWNNAVKKTAETIKSMYCFTVEEEQKIDDKISELMM